MFISFRRLEAWATAGSPRAFPSAQLRHSRYSRDSEQRYEPVSSNMLSCAVRLLARACARRPQPLAPAPTPGAGKAAQPPLRAAKSPARTTSSPLGCRPGRPCFPVSTCSEGCAQLAVKGTACPRPAVPSPEASPPS